MCPLSLSLEENTFHSILPLLYVTIHSRPAKQPKAPTRGIQSNRKPPPEPGLFCYSRLRSPRHTVCEDHGAMEIHRVGDLIPGLPEELSLNCLCRVPRGHHGAMMAVSTPWRDLITDRNSPLYKERARNSLTDQSVVLLTAATPTTLEIVEIDIKTRPTSHTALTVSNTSDIFLEGHACVAQGLTVAVIGGFGPAPDHRPSKSLHLFDTFRRRWRRGADMVEGRGDFAWGVIDGILYVAGGYSGANVGNITATECYDFRHDTWREVAAVPESVAVDVFFVVGGELMVRGWHQQRNKLMAFAYSPVTDSWRTEGKLLDALRAERPLTVSGFAVCGDEVLYMVDLVETRRVWVSERADTAAYLIVKKRRWSQNVMKELERVCRVGEKNECVCSDGGREVKVLPLRNSVALLRHGESDAGKEFHVESVAEDVVTVSLGCPSKWSAAVAEA